MVIVMEISIIKLKTIKVRALEVIEATEEGDATLKIILMTITKKGVSTEGGVEDEAVERKK